MVEWICGYCEKVIEHPVSTLSWEPHTGWVAIFGPVHIECYNEAQDLQEKLYGVLPNIPIPLIDWMKDEE